MVSLYEKIETLCSRKDVTPGKMCSDLSISRGIITDLKKGRKKALSTETLSKIAQYFNISIDFLLGNEQNETPVLTSKDERDISKKMKETLAQLEDAQAGLMFDGEPLDDETKELLAISLQNSLELAKKIAKQKYTPKKYRKPE